MLDVNSIPQSNRQFSLLSEMFYVFLCRKMSLSPEIQKVGIVGSEEELDVCVHRAEGEPGQRQEH